MPLTEQELLMASDAFENRTAGYWLNILFYGSQGSTLLYLLQKVIELKRRKYSSVQVSPRFCLCFLF